MLSRDQTRQVITDAVKKTGGPSAFSRKHDISEGYIINVTSGRVKPGPRISAAVGLVNLKDSWTPIRPTKQD
jgi:hypothetical protein